MTHSRAAIAALFYSLPLSVLNIKILMHYQIKHNKLKKVKAMRNITNFVLLLTAGLLLYSCSNDPLTNTTQSTDGYRQVYYKSGIQDSITCATMIIDYLDLGNMDLTNSDSVRISFDYIAHNTTNYRIYAYYEENLITPVYFFDLNVTGSQNSYKHIEYTTASPSISVFFKYYMRSSGDDCYFNTKNFKIEKK